MKLEFKKVNDSKYWLENPDAIEDELNIIINQLSMGGLSMFEETINENLFDTLMSRLVSSHFTLVNKIDPGVLGFVTVDMFLRGKSKTISIGKIGNSNETKLVNGVLYR